MSSFPRNTLAAVATVTGLLLTACETPDTAPTAQPVVTQTPAAESTAAPSTREVPLEKLSTTALATLATLEVKGRAPKTGYSRDLFGQRWSDDVDVEFGHNGCDTRNDILARDLVATATKAGTRDCVVLSGTLNDPYTGQTIEFTRGSDTSTAVQIDHVVALSDAWQKGAQQLSSAQRTDFANDPRNLQATDGPTNQAKGDSDAASWLPPNRSYRCTYVARQIEVKAAYELWVTQAERNAMERLLTDCGGTAPAAMSTTTAPAAAPTRAPRLVETSAPGGDAYYPNCSAARAAGAAPLYAGQPGYSAKLDRDGDGVACE